MDLTQEEEPQTTKRLPPMGTFLHGKRKRQNTLETSQQGNPHKRLRTSAQPNRNQRRENDLSSFGDQGSEIADKRAAHLSNKDSSRQPSVPSADHSSNCELQSLAETFVHAEHLSADTELSGSGAGDSPSPVQLTSHPNAAHSRSSTPFSTASTPLASTSGAVDASGPRPNSTVPAPTEDGITSGQARKVEARNIVFLPEYPDYKTPIPKGTTLEDICQQYPNHLWGEGLDVFMQWRWSHNMIWENMAPLHERYIELGVVKRETTKKEGFLSNRMRNRRKQLGDDRIKELLAAPKMYPSTTGMAKGLRNIDFVPGEDLPYVASDGAQVTNDATLAPSGSDGLDIGEQGVPNMAGVDAEAEEQSVATHDEEPSSETQPPVDSAKQTPVSAQLRFSQMFQQQCKVVPGMHDQGSFWNIPFWDSQEECMSAIAKIRAAMMKNRPLGAHLVAQDDTIDGVDINAQTNRVLELLGWDDRNRRAYLEGKKTEKDTALERIVVRTIGLMLKKRAYHHVVELGSVVVNALKDGFCHPDMVKQVREAAVGGVLADMRSIHENLSQMWMSIQRSTGQAKTPLVHTSDSSSTGRKRSPLDEDEDEYEAARPSKKARAAEGRSPF